MSKLLYTSKKFQPKTLRVIAQAEAICREWAAQGFDLTLRQLYYQFVARDLIKNTQQEYNKLGSIINDARLAGMLDWDFIVDRTRSLRSLNHWEAPSGVVKSASSWYNRDLWANQKNRVEVWIEKDALVGVIADVCSQNDVPYFSCRGYASQSEMWSAAQRLGQHCLAGQRAVILHLGDHDPSGIDMSRDIQDRLNLFLVRDWARSARDAIEFDADADEEAQQAELGSFLREHWSNRWQVDVQRIALTMDQVREYDPPPNFAKVTDSRFEGYQEIYGEDSWELDALPPTALTALVQEHVDELRDDDQWDIDLAQENEERAAVKRVSDRWDDVQEFLNTSSG